MDYDLALEYSQCIAPLEAREYLVQMNIAEYPHLKVQAKKKYHRSMSRVAYPSGTGKSISVEDFVRKHKYGE